MTDVRMENHGTVVMLRPLTDAGRDWIEENVHAEGWQWFGGALACEPRMVEPVLQGMADAGLTVEA